MRGRGLKNRGPCEGVICRQYRVLYEQQHVLSVDAAGVNCCFLQGATFPWFALCRGTRHKKTQRISKAAAKIKKKAVHSLDSGCSEDLRTFFY